MIIMVQQIGRIVNGIVVGLLFTIHCSLFISCSSTPKDVVMQNALPSIYPDYVGVTVPAEIAPLNFNSTDEAIDCIDVVVKGSKGGELHAQGDFADFDVDEWHQLTAQNKGGQLVFTVCERKDGQWLQYKDFTVDVSAYPLDEWGLTYRRRWDSISATCLRSTSMPSSRIRKCQACVSTATRLIRPILRNSSSMCEASMGQRCSR